jgi:exodeoxyribonuclease VII small subunit
MKNEEKSLEVAFEDLNKIIGNLEKEDISLEDSFKLYQEGIVLLKHCNTALDKVEKQLIVLGEENESEDI